MDKYDAMEAAEKAEMYADEQRDIIAELMQQRDELLAILKITAGNIRSLGPAGALDGVPMPYKEWLAQVEAAIAKSTGAK